MIVVLLILSIITYSQCELTPPYFNLAEGRKITASATCGVDTDVPELFCKLVGANTENEWNSTQYEVIQGQVCDYCDPSRPDKSHAPEYAIDGTESWWQSPPLSRGMRYNEVNLTIDFGQEFHVAYIFIRMGNSPRPGLWTLEKSNDYGKTWTAWQHFSDSLTDCETYFGKESLHPIRKDNDVICTTEYSKIVPLENGEIPVTLLTGRPSANDYFNSPVLQEWTRATNIRIRLMRTKNLLGHLMSVARQDPTVTRRYFYSIKDISIGGRCVCNGHASTCSLLDPRNPIRTLACACQHHTCGLQCDQCCPGFEQKKWRQNTNARPFQCEPCNCHGHSSECIYDEETDNQRLSLDIHGNHEGGGVCQNCQHNTEGINCNKCKDTYFRPTGKYWNETDVCQPCNCNYFFSTGNCEEGTGRCECRKEFEEPDCKACSYGHFGYPNCRPCECNLNGTTSYQCEPITGGKCDCKYNFGGDHCDTCAEGFYDFPNCTACECNAVGSTGYECDKENGQCQCKTNYAEKQCDVCKAGYYNYPKCEYCGCDVQGTTDDVCDKSSGKCLCREGYGGPRCDQCLPGFHGYPDCVPCNCSTSGSVSVVCDATGRCPCLSNFGGRQCTSCQAGYFQYPECSPCNCDPHGSIGISCNADGQCQCAFNFGGTQCNECKEGFYNYPACEECNCDPAGVIAKFAGCGSVPAGELCQCKERVQGRICQECRPLYWNLNATNSQGCEDCDCFIEGTIGALDTCDTKSGQCTCKPTVTGRDCGGCRDGFFDLFGGSLFGCRDCGCDIGGSTSQTCDKTTGQCKCHPRISGRTCTDPLTTHYYPTLYQFQFEYEDGYTPTGAQVRYKYDSEEFPDFSKKGYAVFSQLQNEILSEVFIQKSSVYRLVIRYINPTDENIVGDILITSDNPLDEDQATKVLFKQTTVPQFVTVSGSKADVPSPVVLDPGRYTISIKSKKPNLLLDYFVLLPAAYYEAAILTRNIESPCEVGSSRLCRHYQYPSVASYNPTYEPFVIYKAGANNANVRYTDADHLSQLDLGLAKDFPLLSDDQPHLNYMVEVKKHGKYVIVVDYITGQSFTDFSVVQVNQQDEPEQDGAIMVYPCPYTMVCRAPVSDREAREKIFFIDVNDLRPIEVKLIGEHDVAIKHIAAIPFEDWSTDYIQPSPVCLFENGNCIPSTYRIAPEARTIEFQHAVNRTDLDAKTSKPVLLNSGKDVQSITAKVPLPERYAIVLGYHQPNHPKFGLQFNLTTGDQSYHGKLPVRNCPARSGCRALLAQDNGISAFDLGEEFTFNVMNPHDSRNVFLDYLLVIPFDQYNQILLKEDTYDLTKEFIHNCGSDHFYISVNASDFCKHAVFSLTADYNSGALPCQCDYYGSTSFECEPFGGQCQCKPNVIGRQCDACRTGFYGFPDCKPCDCPATALCEKDTGACICPPRVTGSKCNECIPFTFGFDPIIGCEECNCHPQGVNYGDLQCDLNNGTCACRENIVSRTCDRCQNGHFDFPHCQRCDCSLDGTTFEICDQTDERCFCKKHAEGRRCDKCVDGFYNLQSGNPEGCTKCFCFGKTGRCDRAYLRPFNVSMLNNVTLNSIHIEAGRMSSHQFIDDEGIWLNETSAKVTFNDIQEIEVLNNITYFGTLDFLLNQNNHLSAYGGYLTYNILFANGPFGNAIVAPDIILKGKTYTLVHQSYEQPAPRQLFHGVVHFVESSFNTLTGLRVTREQFMMTLRDLEAIYIRASYWEQGLETALSDVFLTMADDDLDNQHLYQELAIERCDCPPGYQGYSCEDCAPGYYRVEDGLYGGYCLPCDCNGHATTCDCKTGICLDCDHFTTGDHCEQCIEGYYGNATFGTANDCMICACPLPIESNNFATSCEVSDDGLHIRCECETGYTGEKCQSCAPGFFGQPQVEGEICKPCNCSGNIDIDDPSSCDSVSGECLRCLNNTYGTACNLCAPGFYGDAVRLKDCQSCICDSLGTKFCDSFTGICECAPNVVGEKCDRCEDDHYGFDTGYGCQACDCTVASNSSQCDDQSGQCACKPGVTGKHCDRCLPGYWNYSANGCDHCKCNTDYSRGLGCDAETGQCQCLPGVIGEKCDHCPYRWVLIPDFGCTECDTCHHSLLDVTDGFKVDVDTVKADFDEASKPFFTAKKLEYYTGTIESLKPEVEQLDPKGVNLSPHIRSIEQLFSEGKALEKRVTYSANDISDAISRGGNTTVDATTVLNECRLVNKYANNAVKDVKKLVDNLHQTGITKLDTAISEANEVYSIIQQHEAPLDIQDQIHCSALALEKSNAYFEPVGEQRKRLDLLKDSFGEFDGRIEDFFGRAAESRQKSDDAEFLNSKNEHASLQLKFNTIGNQTLQIQSSLNEGKDFLTKADQTLYAAQSARVEIDKENVNLKERNNAVDKQVQTVDSENGLLDDTVREARLKKDELEAIADYLRKEYSNGTSNTAIKAARVYEEIADTTQLAKDIIADAIETSQNATSLTDGIGNRAGKADQGARELLSMARLALKKVQSNLQPHLNSSSGNVNEIIDLNNQSDVKLLALNAALDLVPTESHSDTWTTATTNAEGAHIKAKETLDSLRPIVKEIPNVLGRAKEIPREIDDIGKSIAQINTHLERVDQQFPEILALQEDIAKAQDSTDTRLSSLGDNIDDLKKHVRQARESVNDIKVGLTFYPNTTLELKPPENLAILSNTKVSAYFKTNRPNGFIFYLGNEGNPDEATNNEDFMELELENGYPVLNMDLGNGPEKVIGKKYVADNKWYQFIVDRSGQNIKLTIRDENENGEEIFAETPYELPGDNKLFHWDEDSRVFVGGYPPEYRMQDSVKYNSFVGQIEDLKIGDKEVGLWNFIDGQSNTEGAQERDRLLPTDTPANGLRFGGSGYVALNAKPYSFRDQSSIGFKFKASRDVTDGLLFYVGNNNSFISIELQDGDVVFRFKFNRHAESIRLQPRGKFNDDQWHKVLAERDRTVGVLYVDGKQFYQEQQGTTIAEKDAVMDESDVLFFGGTRQAIPHPEVTSVGFDGCIEDVTFSGVAVDLTNYLDAYNVRPGCPVKYSSIVSYKPGENGYLKIDQLDVNNNFNINLKFRTREENGLIFFATNADQSSSISVAISNGILVLRSNRLEVNSGANRYDDGEWHVITATHENSRLALSIDDRNVMESDEAPAQLYIQHGDIYFGGVPPGFRFKSGVASSEAHFSGCISDVTINNNLVNFASSVDRKHAVLDQCPRDLFEVEPIKPVEIDQRFTDINETENEIVESVPITSTATPTVPPTRKRRPPIVPDEPSCALPAKPIHDMDFDQGWRFGTALYSNVQFNNNIQLKRRNAYNVTLEFRTDKPDGVIFYAKDQRHTDFIAIYLRNGFVYHTFNAGTGTSNTSSSLSYNDNEWHTVSISRHGNKGRLIVDGSDENESESSGAARNTQFAPPLYVGGIAQEDIEDAALNLKVEKDQLERRSFFGCIRNILIGGKAIGEPASINNVVPCSDQIEKGTFFEGGFVKLREKFSVGSEVKIQFDMKPRTRNGFLMSVHGKKSFLILQLINGTIHFSVDNGDGPLVAIFKPVDEDNFCDGTWRTITAVKTQYVITIQVNNVVSEPAIGTSTSVNTETTRPLFLGSHPHIKKIRGLKVREPYRGCIRNLKIRDSTETITTKMVVGDARVGVCPLN